MLDHYYLKPFLEVMEGLKRYFPEDFPFVSDQDIGQLRDLIESFKCREDPVFITEEIYYLFEQRMDSLLQSSFAHFLYFRCKDLPMGEYHKFHPNNLQMAFLNDLIETKGSVKLEVNS